MKKQILSVLAFILIATAVFAQPATKLPVGETFYIQSAYCYGRSDKGYWDIGGVNDVAKGEDIKIWGLDDGNDRIFKVIESPIPGYYELQIGNWDSRVDIRGGKTDKGTQLQVWTPNGSSAQRFLFHHLGDGRFQIVTQSGRIVCLKEQNENNGNVLHLWTPHSAINTEWYLIRTSNKQKFVPTDADIMTMSFGDPVPEDKQLFIQSAVSYGRTMKGFWDLSGKAYNINDNDIFKNRANLAVWTKDEGVDRFFGFEKAGNSGYYNIRANLHSGFSVDVEGGKTHNGNNVIIWKTDLNNPNQQFYFKHLGEGRFKIYHRSGKILVLKGGASDANGTNVHLWEDHDKAACEWYILQGGSPYIPSDAPSKVEGQ